MAAELIGIREPAFSHIGPYAGSADESNELPPDPSPSVAMRLELRQRLERLWPEVLLLSARHRGALLLSARAPATRAAVCLMVDLGIASFREVAAALEITVEELAELWNRLPLEDSEIAATSPRLGAPVGDQPAFDRPRTPRAPGKFHNKRREPLIMRVEA